MRSSEVLSDLGLALFPVPKQVRQNAGKGIMRPSGLQVDSPFPFVKAAAVLQRWLKKHGFQIEQGLPVTWKQHAHLKPESFELSISQEGVHIYAGDERGALYATTALCQVIEQTTADLPAIEITDAPDLCFRCAYIDLRTQKFTIGKLKEIISRLAYYRYNSVVVEYESTFPHDVEPLRDTESRYTLEEIRALEEWANAHGIEYVPLQQTMGHLEYILHHPSHHTLCESGEAGQIFVDEICPLNPDALPFVLDLLDAVMAAHSGRYVHVGGDEVWHLASCPRCQTAAKTRGKAHLYTAFMQQVLQHVIDAGRIPIYWADVLAKFPQSLAELPQQAIPAEWYYGAKVGPSAKWVQHLRQQGLRVMTASSVHCGLPEIYGLDVERRLLNIQSMSRMTWEEGAEGSLITNWNTIGRFMLHRQDVKVTKEGYDPRLRIEPLGRRAHADITWPLLVWGAECLWNARQPHVQYFKQGIGQTLFGLTDNETAAFFDAYALLDGFVERHEPSHLLQSFEQAVSRLEGMHPRRNLAIWERIRLSARLGQHNARRMMLGAGPPGRRDELAPERAQLVQTMRQLYSQDMFPSEVEAEIKVRFPVVTSTGKETI